MTKPSGDRREILAVIGGVLATLVMNVAGYILIMVFQLIIQGDSGDRIFLTGALLLGVIQLCWMVPLILYSGRHGHIGFCKGLMIGTALTSLLNIGCGWLDPFQLPGPGGHW